MQLNHIFKTRDVVRKSDARISKHQEIINEEMLPGDGCLDQGFTRPKVYLHCLMNFTYIHTYIFIYTNDMHAVADKR